VSQRIDRAGILRLIAQQGLACLLEEVLEWDEQRLLARGVDPRAASHPLRAHGRLGSALALEYAAQAACAHGALLGATAPSSGGAAVTLLASARSVLLDTTRLDIATDPLLIEVRPLHATAAGALYEFRVPPDAPVARGRLGLLVARA
jgi:predicted hotdog family 3-hydroxylacyl-ACP dehydratase